MVNNYNFDIDFVIPWVDGSDSKWQEEKKKYMPQIMNDTNADYRYRDWGTLKYWFRAVEKYAPWVRKIHFITCGHLPDFLDTDNPKINIVNHKDYIPEQYLPTFNSNAIEINIHRINDLTEHFIYFNDDTFINAPISPEDFFDSNGIPRIYYAELPYIKIGKLRAHQMFAINDLYVVNKHFDRIETFKKHKEKFCSRKNLLYNEFVYKLYRTISPHNYLGFMPLHCPSPICKSTLQEIWDKEFDLLDATSSNKFRNVEDVNQWLILDWQIASANFLPHNLDTAVYLIKKSNIRRICKDIYEQKKHLICMNDEQITMQNELQEKIINAFEKAYPDKSSFEK